MPKLPRISSREAIRALNLSSNLDRQHALGIHLA